MGIVVKHALSALKPHVIRTRSCYRDGLLMLPSPLRKVADRHMQVRLRRAKSRPLLGEYAPWLMADILGITNVPAVQRVAMSWLHVYFFTLMLDDAIDRPVARLPARDLIVASLLLQRGLSRLLEGGSIQMAEHLDSAFTRTALAALMELQTQSQRVRALSADPSQVGQKVALLRICARSVASLAGRNDAVIDDLVDNIALGFQLLDDITDLQEDYQGSRVSAPLALLYSRCRIRKKASADDLIGKIVETGAMSEILQAGLRAFEEALIALDALKSPSSGAAAREYLEEVIGATSNALQVVDSVRLQIGTPVLRRQSLRRVKSALDILAQGGT